MNTYKVWIEIEEVENDEFYDNIDAVFVGEVNTKEEAFDLANKIAEIGSALFCQEDY